LGKEKCGDTGTFEVFRRRLSEQREITPPLAPSSRKNCSNPDLRLATGKDYSSPRRLISPLLEAPILARLYYVPNKEQRI